MNRLRVDPTRRRVLLNPTPSDYNTIYLSLVPELVRKDLLFRRYFKDFEEVVINPLKREKALKIARSEEMENVWLRLENAILARRNARTLYAQIDETAKSLMMEALWLQVTFEHIPPFTTFDKVSTDIYIREREQEVSYS